MQKTREYLLTISKAILALGWNMCGTECCLEPQSVMPSENRLNIWLEIEDYFASLKFAGEATPGLWCACISYKSKEAIIEEYKVMMWP